MSQYGYTQDEHGQFEGVMGALQRYKCDMLATAIQPRVERLPVADLIAETYKLGWAAPPHVPYKFKIF